MSEIVGGSFTEVTIKTNVSALDPPDPSLTMTVIVVVPNRFCAGVMVTVRFVPLPPKTMLAFGASVVLEDEPETVRLPAAVSSSTVNGIAPVAVSSAVILSAIFEIEGGVFDGDVTVRVKVSLAVNSPSLTVMVMMVTPD